ncbi:hypothetical protein LQE88_07880 [Acidaminococcus sp. NSJ-142]|uniref:hypothetical protein n=1 Tax=Acidaminococcus hominis TaxID=2897706 RepID=UPI001E59D97C|nr:hypothetical protein [Acidaminococcus hominis]MCD2435902.1 hypothetical protein [Acidaminococcus hominis]
MVGGEIYQYNKTPEKRNLGFVRRHCLVMRGFGGSKSSGKKWAAQGRLISSSQGMFTRQDPRAGLGGALCSCTSRHLTLLVGKVSGEELLA